MGKCSALIHKVNSDLISNLGRNKGVFSIHHDADIIILKQFFSCELVLTRTFYIINIRKPQDP